MLHVVVEILAIIVITECPISEENANVSGTEILSEISIDFPLILHIDKSAYSQPVLVLLRIGQVLFFKDISIET